MDDPKQTEYIKNVSQEHLSRRKYILIVASFIGIALVGIVLASYFFSYASKADAREYVIKSQPLFETIARQMPIIKENTLLDKNTQYSKREYAREDAVLDIKELRAGLAEIENAKEEIEQLALPEEVIPLNDMLQSYLDEAQRVLSLSLEDQVFYKEIIDRYGNDLDREISVFYDMYNLGGERAQFILQTDRISGFAKDALSRINNLKPPEYLDTFSYELRKEGLRDIVETYGKVSEYYRLGLDDLIGPELEAISERIKTRNEQSKIHSGMFVEESIIATGFKSLEEQAKELKDLYSSMTSIQN